MQIETSGSHRQGPYNLQPTLKRLQIRMKLLKRGSNSRPSEHWSVIFQSATEAYIFELLTEV